MENYKFTFKDSSYELREDNCDYFLNDEEKPVEDFNLTDMLELLSQYGAADFDVEYYDQPCKECKAGIKEKSKYFKFLEYHFYLFTKSDKYVLSNISREYEDTTYNKLLKKAIVDNSYIVSVMVCEGCGNYSVEIEQCEI